VQNLAVPGEEQENEERRTGNGDMAGFVWFWESEERAVFPPGVYGVLEGGAQHEAFRQFCTKK
jgi:hypothetical protein